jgi:Glycosyl transferase family 2
MTRVAACTMVWNESLFLPIWIRHYGRQIGMENLYVIDNDSDDGSTDNLPLSRIRYPRTDFSDARRVRFVEQFVATLLNEYDVVIYSDCDEMLVTDPLYSSGLAEYFAKVDGNAYIAKGLNVYHVLTDEAPFDPSQPCLSQRHHAMFVSPMCKTLATRQPIHWNPGFHASSIVPAAGPLYNFHLRWIDVGYSLKRLAMTRAMSWEDKSSWHYQRQPDEDMLNMYMQNAKLERRIDEEFQFEPQMASVLSEIQSHSNHPLCTFNQGLRDNHFTRIPDRFQPLL